ncbi:unnamed protein product [Lactuca virosa]|nr:unnamed protein product [Lactuca virosa]
MREYYCYKFQIRPNYNVILLGGRLLQQFVVDIYIKLETSRFDFCRKNQSKIRADLYQGVVDCVNAGEVRPTMIGQRVVFPASFIGDNGIEVDIRGNKMDNRWVVPYNPKLLMMFNCHMNVEVCSSITSVKYVFKYIYKGHDKQVINIDPDGEPVVINEIKRYQDARYVSPPEEIWRIFSFPLSQIYPCVMALQVHLPNQQLVRFSEDDTLTSVVEKERDNRSMLTAFFLKNKEDIRAREYKYIDFPKKFTWDPKSRPWNHRKLGLMRGRLVSANPAEGERYYLRLLLLHISGPTCFEDLYTVNNIKYPTFRKAALERGLIESDDDLSQCLTDASLFQFLNALRRLFATILSFCEPGDVRKLWHEHYNGLSEDYRRQYGSVERVQNMVLTEIMVFLQSMGDRIDDFDLPKINQNVDLEFGVFREVQEECSIVLEPEHLQARDSLNPEQKFAYDEIMRHVHNDIPGVFFIDGPSGTGKIFLYKALLSNIRSCGHIALATASSGVAANNMPGGRTAHSRFKIPFNLENNSVCKISRQSGTAQLLRTAKVII